MPDPEVRSLRSFGRRHRCWISIKRRALPSPTCLLGQGGRRESGMWPDRQRSEPFPHVGTFLLMRRCSRTLREKEDNDATIQRSESEVIKIRKAVAGGIGIGSPRQGPRHEVRRGYSPERGSRAMRGPPLEKGWLRGRVLIAPWRDPRSKDKREEPLPSSGMPQEMIDLAVRQMRTGLEGQTTPNGLNSNPSRAEAESGLADGDGSEPPDKCLKNDADDA